MGRTTKLCFARAASDCLAGRLGEGTLCATVDRVGPDAAARARRQLRLNTDQPVVGGKPFELDLGADDFGLDGVTQLLEEAVRLSGLVPGGLQHPLVAVFDPCVVGQVGVA